LASIPSDLSQNPVFTGWYKSLLIRTLAYQTKLLFNMRTKNILPTAFALVCLTILFKCGGLASDGSASDPVVSGNTTTINASNGSTMQLDNNTDLQTGSQGLVVEKVYIVDENDKPLMGSTVAMNTKFAVIYEGVENYALKDGKAFPKLSIFVSDGTQNPVINETDLLANYSDGLSVDDASVLRASITVGEPMKPGKYNCSVQISDKNNKDAYIVSTWSFDVK
jgi:hypothetical protein